MDPVVAIPWRPEPSRLEAYEYVLDFWAKFGWDIVQADSDPAAPFQLSQARNNAVRQTTGPVIIADADTVPEADAIHQALKLVGGTVIYPFEEYVTLPRFTNNLTGVKPLAVNTASVGGVIVTDTETYWGLGGMDEQFKRWGFEDNAFAAAALTLAKVIRTPGRVYSFDHPVSGGRVHGEANPNHRRYQLYLDCLHKPELMRELIK
jgi:hypothetical protein